MLCVYLEYYNQFKVQLPAIAATFNLLLKIDSRSLIKTFICSEMVQAPSRSDFIFRDLYEMSEESEGEFSRMVTSHPNPLHFRYSVFFFASFVLFPPTSIVSPSLFSTMVYFLNFRFAFIWFYFCFIFTNSLPYNRQILTTI